MIDDVSVIICTPADSLDLRKPYTIPGSREVNGACGHQVIVGPSSVKMMDDNADRTFQLLCVTCYLAEPEPNEPLVLPPGALDEIRGLDDVALSDQALALIRDLGIEEYRDE